MRTKVAREEALGRAKGDVLGDDIDGRLDALEREQIIREVRVRGEPVRIFANRLAVGVHRFVILALEIERGATIGPAYSDVAAKYSPAADTTVNRLVKKIITGGSGIWGTVPMTPHPALKEEDVKTIVTYILTLKN